MTENNDDIMYLQKLLNDINNKIDNINNTLSILIEDKIMMIQLLNAYTCVDLERIIQPLIEDLDDDLFNCRNILNTKLKQRNIIIKKLKSYKELII